MLKAHLYFIKTSFFEIRYFVAKREIHSMWTRKRGHILGLHLKEVIKDKPRIPWYLSQEFLHPYFMDRVQWRKMNFILRRTLSPQTILLIHLQCLQVCPFWVQSRLSQCFFFSNSNLYWHCLQSVLKKQGQPINQTDQQLSNHQTSKQTKKNQTYFMCVYKTSSSYFTQPSSVSSTSRQGPLTKMATFSSACLGSWTGENLSRGDPELKEYPTAFSKQSFK